MLIYLSLPGIVGEETSAPYAGYFDILSYSWGVETQATFTSSGKSSPSELSLQRQSNKGSSSLYVACARGTHFSAAKLVVVDPTTALETFDLFITNVIIGSYSMSNSSGGGPPVEQITLQFETARYTYYYVVGGVAGSERETFDFVLQQ